MQEYVIKKKKKKENEDNSRHLQFVNDDTKNDR